MSKVKARLHKKREQLVIRKAQLLEKLMVLPADALTEPPAEGRWSLLQVAEHLMLVEHLAMEKVHSKKEQGTDALVDRPRLYRHRLRFCIVYLALRFGIRVKVPSDAMVPTGSRALEEVVVLWNQAHARMEQYIEVTSEAELQRNYFYHPPSGPLSLSGLLTLGVWHFDSHMRKINGSLTNGK